MVLDLRRAFCSSIPKEDEDHNDDQQTDPSNNPDLIRSPRLLMSSKLLSSFFSSPLSSTTRRRSYSSSSAPSSPKHPHATDDHQYQQKHQQRTSHQKRRVLKLYNDDEPLSSPATYNTRFNSIPEEEYNNYNNETDDFPGFFVHDRRNDFKDDSRKRRIEIDLLPHAASSVVLSRGGSSNNTNNKRSTYGVVLRIKALADDDRSPVQRVPIDLVMVIHVNRRVDCDQIAKPAMMNVISSLTSSDRLSIVGFIGAAAASKRLLPLRRMNAAGRRAARRIIDEIAFPSTDGTAYSASASAEAVRKAAKVVGDRREKNATASIVVIRKCSSSREIVSLTRLDQDLNTTVPVCAVNLGASDHAPDGESILTGIIGLSGAVVLQDLKVQLSLESGSGEILAVYSGFGKPDLLGSGSDWIRIGDFYSKEQKELLVELDGPNGLLTFRCSYTDPLTQQAVYENELQLLVQTVGTGSSDPEIQRLRCRFIVARATVEGRRLIERNDVLGARRVLAWARALVLKTGSGENYVLGLEAELADLDMKLTRYGVMRRNEETVGDEMMSTPVSAWKVAQRLASMRKSLNRVGDLHGLEDARF